MCFLFFPPSRSLTSFLAFILLRKAKISALKPTISKPNQLLKAAKLLEDTILQRHLLPQNQTKTCSFSLVVPLSEASFSLASNSTQVSYTKPFLKVHNPLPRKQLQCPLNLSKRDNPQKEKKKKLPDFQKKKPRARLNQGVLLLPPWGPHQCSWVETLAERASSPRRLQTPSHSLTFQ